MKTASRLLTACLTLPGVIAGTLANTMVSATVSAEEPGAVSLDIPEQPMQTALNALAEQTGLQVIFTVPEVAGKSSCMVKGRYTPETAMQILLSGTQLSFQF